MPRRSTRLISGRKPNYTEPETSDDDDEDFLPLDLVSLIQQALATANGDLITELDLVCDPPRAKRKRKRPDNTKLPVP